MGTTWSAQPSAHRSVERPRARSLRAVFSLNSWRPHGFQAEAPLPALLPSRFHGLEEQGARTRRGVEEAAAPESGGPGRSVGRSIDPPGLENFLFKLLLQAGARRLLRRTRSALLPRAHSGHFVLPGPVGGLQGPAELDTKAIAGWGHAERGGELDSPGGACSPRGPKPLPDSPAPLQVGADRGNLIVAGSPGIHGGRGGELVGSPGVMGAGATPGHRAASPLTAAGEGSLPAQASQPRGVPRILYPDGGGGVRDRGGLVSTQISPPCTTLSPLRPLE